MTSRTLGTIGRRAVLGAPVALFVARAARAEDAGELIARAQAKMTTMQGPFTQERTIGLLKSTVRSKGTLVMARPDRLRWELAPPDEVVYWVTPEGFAYKSAQGKGSVPASSAKLAASLDDVRALLGDVSRLRARYDLIERLHDGGATVEATPKDGPTLVRSAFKKITLELGPDLVRPLRATLVETARDRTEIVFGELRVNEPVDPKLLVPPS